MKFRLLKPKSFRLSSIVMLRKFLMFAARWQRSAIGAPSAENIAAQIKR